MITTSISPIREIPNGRSASIAIAVGAALTLFAILHHPHLEGPSGGNVMGALAALATIDRVVHGAVIALALAAAYGFAIFASRLGLHRPSVLAGIVAYTFGTGATIGAALIDGFVISDVAERYVAAAPDVLARVYPLLGICGSAIEACTVFGFLALAAATLAWAIPLAFAADVPTRAAGILGCVSALLTASLLATTHGPLEPRSLLTIVLAQTIWSACAAFLLLTRRV